MKRPADVIGRPHHDYLVNYNNNDSNKIITINNNNNRDNYLGCRADISKKPWINYTDNKPEIMGNLLSIITRTC